MYINTKQHNTTISALLLSSMGIFLFCNSFAAAAAPFATTTDLTTEVGARKAADTDLQNQIKSISPPTPIQYQLGDTGPNNGKVYYVDGSGHHGLEAQARDAKAIDGNTFFSWDSAVQAAIDTSAYGPGWHLPTKNELALLYEQKKVVGGFANVSYWSSTESVSGTAWLQSFNSGLQYNLSKSNLLRVRAVRAF